MRNCVERRVTQPKPGYLVSGVPHLHVNRPLVSNFHSDMRVRGGGLETKSIVPGALDFPSRSRLSPPPPQPVYSHSLFERRGGLHTGYRETYRTLLIGFMGDVTSELSKNVW